MTLILASASPRRKELLERVGIEIVVLPADVDESIRAGEDAIAYARRVASDKAAAVAAREPGAWILAADTVVEIAGEILGKARNREEARAMLQRLQGHSHRVTTAMALSGAESECIAVTTEVRMRPVDAAELDDYLDAGEWRGKAGAYAVQGMAAAFVTELRGSVTNVIGLPLAEALTLLSAHGVTGPAYARRGSPAR